MVVIVSTPMLIDIAKNIGDSNTTQEIQKTPEKLVKVLNSSLDYLNNEMLIDTKEINTKEIDTKKVKNNQNELVNEIVNKVYIKLQEKLKE